MLVSNVYPSNGKAKKYGDFYLNVWLNQKEISKVKLLLNIGDINLAFQSFTNEHLEEHFRLGFCKLETTWEKELGHDRNNGELFDDALWLADILDTKIYYTENEKFFKNIGFSKQNFSPAPSMSERSILEESSSM